jgi:hypothetical protein
MILVRFPDDYLLTEERVAKWQELHPGIRLARFGFGILSITEEQLPFHQLDFIPLELPEEDRLSEHQCQSLIILNPSMRLEISQLSKIKSYLPYTQKQAAYHDILKTQFFQWAKAKDMGELKPWQAAYLLPGSHAERMLYMRSLLSYQTYIDAPKEMQRSWPDDFHLTPPRFVVDVCYSKRQLQTVLRKMQEQWMASGVSFGILITPNDNSVYVTEAAGSEKYPIKIPFTHRLLSGFEGDFTGYLG